MAVLLLADVNNGALTTDAVAKTLSAVKALGEVHILVAGPAAAAAEAAKLEGAAKVLHADDAGYGLPEWVAAKASNFSAWLEYKVEASNRPDLTSAKIVVSGGRGVGSKRTSRLWASWLTSSAPLLVLRAQRSIWASAGWSDP